jgi:4-hydroxy-tetrahydrodipicolinate synthase
MNPPALPKGIWSAVLTPVDAQLRPDVGKAIDYYRWLLREGIDGLNVLGTSGEAPSLGIRERIAYTEAVAADLPVDRIMVGTGTTSLDDTVRLTQTALDCGFAAALIMPPFFYRDAGDDGIVAFLDALLSRLNDPGRRLMLYNFPAASGITFRAALVDRLIAEFPEAIIGMKDSSNDARLQREILAQHRHLAVLPSSEEHICDARELGTWGCISGSVALWPQLAQRVWKTGEGAQRLAALRKSVAGPKMLARVRYLTGKARGDDWWERPMPPLTALTPEEKNEIDAAISRCA